MPHAGIYANEGRDTKIYRNIVRRIGYYDPQDGSGLWCGGDYLKRSLPGPNIGEPGATGILISNGDLDGPGRPPLEVGRVYGIEVYENVISCTRKAAISVWNEWRKERREGWCVDGIRIDNNVCYGTCLGPNPVSAAILFDAGATNLHVRNNIIAGSASSIWKCGTARTGRGPPCRHLASCRTTSFTTTPGGTLPATTRSTATLALCWHRNRWTQTATSVCA